MAPPRPRHPHVCSEASASVGLHQIHLPPDLGVFSLRSRSGKASRRELVWKPSPAQAKSPGSLTHREFGTWEVNSLIKTVQNPNFAEWQFGGEKKPSNGKMLVMQH